MIRKKFDGLWHEGCIEFVNKNNYVIRLAPYLTTKNYFEKVCIMFLVAGHTKNTAD